MEKTVLYQGKKICYSMEGSGRAVMLVHGFGEDHHVWKEQVDFLKPHFQLIIPQLPGSGQSEMIDDMSMEGMAASLVHLLKSEGITSCIIIGHSMGGYITLALAEKHGEILSSFGLFHSTAYADSDEKKELRKKGIEFIRQHGAFEFLKSTSYKLFSPATREEKPGLIEEQIERLRNFPPGSQIAYYQGMMNRPDRTHVLKKSVIPVLFIIGEHDAAVPMEEVLQQCHLPEKSYIHILKKSGHMGMLEEPDIANRILIDFLRQS